jgi:streptogramin lyase
MTFKRLWRRFCTPVTLTVLALALTSPPGASALLPGEIEEFIGAVKPFTVTNGPDGNVWFTEQEPPKIGRVIVSGENRGKITEYGGLSSIPFGIVTGPDGNVWFTEPFAAKIGRCDPTACESTVEEFSLPEGSTPTYIAKGPDGNLWFIDVGKPRIGKITPAGIIVEYPLTAGAAPCAITAGSDGNVWFGDCGTPRQIGKITPAGAIAEYELSEAGPTPTSMALNSDGNVWFALSDGGIGKVTPSGEISYYDAPVAQFTLKSLTTGSDGFVWGANVFKQNEVQEVTVKAEGAAPGATFRLLFGGCETAPISPTATNATFDAAIEAMPCGVAGNVTVANGTAPPSPFVGKSWRITFGGKFARTDVPQLQCDAGFTGTNPSCEVKTIIEARTERFVRFKPDGKITEFAAPPATTVPFVVNTGTVSGGPDGNLWFATETGGKIGTFALGFIVDAELTVSKEGGGDGVVVSNPAGIECGATCSSEFEAGKHVTLTASPDSLSLFVGWKGCDQVIGRQCLVTVDKARTVSAKYVRAHALTASKAEGSGAGKVTSYPSGILCLANCSTTTTTFKEGAKVKLTPTPSKHFHFVEWLGACTGSGPCEPTMNEDREAEALFAEDPKHSLDLSKEGGGQGTVKSLPAGINCGPTCGSTTALFYAGEIVALTATPGKGSTFEGWSGGGCSGTGTCTVTMGGATSVKAKFG